MLRPLARLLSCSTVLEFFHLVQQKLDFTLEYTEQHSRMQINIAIPSRKQPSLSSLRNILASLLPNPPPVTTIMRLHYHCKGLYTHSYAILSFLAEGISISSPFQPRVSMKIIAYLNIVYASLWAGSFTLGSSSKSWIPRRTCVMGN